MRDTMIIHPWRIVRALRNQLEGWTKRHWAIPSNLMRENYIKQRMFSLFLHICQNIFYRLVIDVLVKVAFCLGFFCYRLSKLWDYRNRIEHLSHQKHVKGINHYDRDCHMHTYPFMEKEKKKMFARTLAWFVTPLWKNWSNNTSKIGYKNG